MRPLVLKTKYAFHTLLWALNPDVVFDIGSMDGADSKRFRSLLRDADLVAFEANPNNFRLMEADKDIHDKRIRVINQLVSGSQGIQSFYIQRPEKEAPGLNRGTSSALPRTESGMRNEEVQVASVRIDSFITQNYPQSSKVAMWVDVEGFAYEALESMSGCAENIKLIHVEVETSECWPGQKLEPDVVGLLQRMGFILLAHGKHNVQRDLILVHRSWYHSKAQGEIDTLLKLSHLAGPAISRALSLVPAKTYRS